MYDYAITTLADMLGKAAAQNGDKALSNYKGLPTAIDINADSELVAEIKFQTNSAMYFQIFLTEPGLKHLKISCKTGFLNISPNFVAGNFVVEFHFPGEVLPQDNRPLADYQKALDDGLRTLIVIQSEQALHTNK